MSQRTTVTVGNLFFLFEQLSTGSTLGAWETVLSVGVRNEVSLED